MRRSLRFLFLYSATGGGHLRASRAVAEELERRGAEAVVVDVLKEYAPWPFSGVPEGYSRMLFGGGVLYGWIFRILDHPRLLAPLHSLLWPWFRKAALRLLAENRADLVVVSHPLPVSAVAKAAKELGRLPVVVLTTDLVVAHSLNVSADVGFFIVATGLAREQLRMRGVTAEIHEVGLPVTRAFADCAGVDPAKLRHELGLDREVPVILVMTGGVGWGDVGSYVDEFLRLERPMQIVVVAGGNKSLRARLERRYRDSGVLVTGYLEEIHRWMRAADLLVTKAGPNTIAEALVIGLPMILTHAIPEQETPNVKWVVDSGAGVWAPGPRECAETVVNLMTDDVQAEVMRRNARRLARPEAARDAAELLFRIAGATEEQAD